MKFQDLPTLEDQDGRNVKYLRKDFQNFRPFFN